MQTFEQSMNQLMQEIDPRRINLSNDIYNFSQLEKANANQLPYFLQVGRLKNSSLSLPALVPFIDSPGMIYLYNRTDEDNAKQYMQNLLVDLINKISPNLLDIIVYDPVYLGNPFLPIKKFTADKQIENVTIELIHEEQQLQSQLQKYIQESGKLIEKELFKFGSFTEYWERSNHSPKKYSIFVLNDSGFTRNTTITGIISRITANTKNNNSFFILSDLDDRKANFSFFNSEFIVENRTNFYNGLSIDLEYEKVAEKLRNNVASVVGKQVQKPITIETFDIKEGIKIPIGRLSNGKALNFQLGYDKALYHAIIGGESGSGKSNLLRVIIQGGLRHPKEELCFLLFDCMGSNDFRRFEGSPNVLACERSGDILSVVDKLQMVEREIENRIKLLEEHDVDDIKGLIAKGVKVPRWLIVLDEFHHLYLHSNKTTMYVSNLLVQKILKGGRKYGIHLLAATQSLNDGVGAEILNNIPLRIALPMNEGQSQKFLAQMNSAAMNLEKHHAVYNDNRGDRESNQIFLINKAD